MLLHGAGCPNVISMKGVAAPGDRVTNYWRIRKAAGRSAAAQDVPVERLAEPRRLERTDQGSSRRAPLGVAVVESLGQSGQGPGVPPEGYTARTVELGVLGGDHEVRSGDADAHVAER